MKIQRKNLDDLIADMNVGKEGIVLPLKDFHDIWDTDAKVDHVVPVFEGAIGVTYAGAVTIDVPKKDAQEFKNHCHAVWAGDVAHVRLMPRKDKKTLHTITLP